MSTKTKDHLFCGNCGSSLGVDFKGQPEDRLAMNVSNAEWRKREKGGGEQMNAMTDEY